METIAHSVNACTVIGTIEGTHTYGAIRAIKASTTHARAMHTQTPQRASEEKKKNEVYDQKND